MPVRITEIEFCKKNKKRVVVYTDDGHFFEIGWLEATGLCVGGEISAGKIETLLWEDEQKRAYNAALTFLTPRARSCHEMKIHLRRKQFADESIDKVIIHLLRQKYLDDSDFAEQWLESRKKFAPRGEFLLKQELLQKGIDESLIDQLLASVDELPLAMKALEKKFRYSPLTGVDLKKKIWTFLGNKGFAYETVREAFELFGSKRTPGNSGA